MKSILFSNKKKIITLILLLCALTGILLIIFLEKLLPTSNLKYHEEMIEAALLMEKCTGKLVDEREQRNITIDLNTDINKTGLIGIEFSEITTSIGNLEAKRTVSNPNFAALMVRLYKEAGLKSGDTVAMGASGSFPGAVIASLCAAEVMDLKVLAVLSVGASNWGANIPEFNLLDMYETLQEFLPLEFIAVSLGGAKDTGSDMGFDLVQGGRDYLLHRINEDTIPFIFEDNLEKSITRRLKLFSQHANDSKIKAFINIGGADANIGESLWSLELMPGVNAPYSVKTGISLTEGGLAAAFLESGIPVIHILNIKTLALTYGLTYDPYPIPGIGEEKVFKKENSAEKRITVIVCLTIYILILIFAEIRINKLSKNE